MIEQSSLEGYQDWQIHSRNKESFNFAREIHRPYGHLDAVLQWCKSELQEDWRWQMVEMSYGTQPGRYIFYFDGERDCVAFALKWG